LLPVRNLAKRFDIDQNAGSDRLLQFAASFAGAGKADFLADRPRRRERP
jgi:hypothetical protein